MTDTPAQPGGPDHERVIATTTGTLPDGTAILVTTYADGTGDVLLRHKGSPRWDAPLPLAKVEVD